MLPTFVKDSSRFHQPRSSPNEVRFIFRRSILWRAITAVFLLWWAFRFSSSVWNGGWGIALALAVIDGVVAGYHLVHPHQLATVVVSIVALDALFGWVIAWSYNQSPHSMIPVLLSLITIEVIAYWPDRRGIIITAGYIVVTNGLMGVLPGLNHTPLWSWTQVASWIAVDGLVWGALITLAHRSSSYRSLTALTPREYEVYQLAKAGLTTGAIAERLHIEVSTVKSHLVHIHRKLGVHPHSDH